MPLYNQKSIVDTISKTRYERAHRIEIHNPLNGVPRIVMRTSWVERDDNTGTEEQQESYRVLEDVYVPSEVFDVMDTNGDVVGQASHEALMGVLYGLFFHLAAKEDS
jgi:hypothetical protein